MKKIQALNADGKVCEFNGTEWINPDKVQDEHTEDIKQPQQFKPQQKRTRRFCLTSYIDRTELERFVSSLPWVQHWAMCTHDRDINEDGTTKELHTHVLLYTYEAKVSTAVKKNFDRFSAEVYSGTDTEPQNTLVQICHDMSAQWRYLIHKDNDDKVKYNESERICDDFSYWHKLDLTSGMTDAHKNTSLAIVHDILNGTPTMTMLERYGRDFAINRSRYYDVAREHIRETTFGKKEIDTFDVTELCSLLLSNSTFDDKTLNSFYIVLDYLRAECMLSYGAKPNFILQE